MTGLETAIRNVLKRDNVTFAELSRIEGFNGNLALVNPANNNIIYWMGMSEQAVSILERLQADGVFP